MKFFNQKKYRIVEEDGVYYAQVLVYEAPRGKWYCLDTEGYISYVDVRRRCAVSSPDLAKKIIARRRVIHEPLREKVVEYL